MRRNERRINHHAAGLQISRSLVRALFGAIVLLTHLPALTAKEPERRTDAAMLNLRQGDFLSGKLTNSAQPNVVSWQSGSFTQPFEFPLDKINALHFSAAFARPSGEYCFELADDDMLFGSLLGVSDDEVQLEAVPFGRLHVARTSIRGFYRWRGADVIYLGPNGLVGWKEVIADKKSWLEENGHPFTDKPWTSIYGDLGLPAQAAIEFELSWKNKPDFVFALGVKDDDKIITRQAFHFEVWDDELIIQMELNRAADVASLQKLPAGAGRTHLVAYLDQEKGRLMVFSPAGVPLADLNIAAEKPQVHQGFRLTNKRGDVRLERLRILRWNGMPPRTVPRNEASLTHTDGTTTYGRIVSFDPIEKHFTIRNETNEIRVAAADVASVHLSPPKETSSPTMRAVCQDSTRLSGELIRVDAGQLWMNCPGIKQPLPVAVSGLRSLVMLKQQAETLSSSPEEGTGVLQMEGVRLSGRLRNGQEGSEASCLVWHPEFSATSSPLRSGVDGRIVYREPPPPPPKPNPPQMQQRRPVGFVEGFLQSLAGANLPPAVSTAGGPATLHLRKGDTIPCEVSQIDENGITFKTPLSDATFVTHDKVKTLQLVAEHPGPKLKKAKRERLLTLPRMQRDSPPTHLLCSKNGDFLRGRLIDMDDKLLHIEVRLETKEVPRDRIARIIWLHADELPDSKSSVSNSTEVSTITRVQTLRNDGLRLTFLPDRLLDNTLSGTSDVLGACRADLSQIDQLLIGAAIEQDAASLTFHSWKLHPAIEPKIAQDADGQVPTDRVPGTESALVGKPAPDFELSLLDERPFHLANSKGRIVVLDFWATWCGPCLQAMPQVDRVVREFEEQGVQLIAVNLEESAKQIKSTLERHKLQVTVALDRDGVVAAKYEATAIPQTVIIDREGNVARIFVGGGPYLADQLRDAIRAALAVAEANKPAP